MKSGRKVKVESSLKAKQVSWNLKFYKWKQKTKLKVKFDPSASVLVVRKEQSYVKNRVGSNQNNISW